MVSFTLICFQISLALLVLDILRRQQLAGSLETSRTFSTSCFQTSWLVLVEKTVTLEMASLEKRLAMLDKHIDPELELLQA